MRNVLLAIGMALLLMQSAVAQQDESKGEKPKRVKRISPGEESADSKGAVQVAQPRERARGLDELAERLKKELNLDADQSKKLDDIVAKTTESAGQTRSKGEDIRPLVDEMREAIKSGDKARAAELRDQIKSMRGPGSRMDDFYTKVEGILRDDQKEALAKTRERATPRMVRPDRPPVDRIRELRERLELTDEQQPKFDQLAQELQSKLKNRGAVMPDDSQMEIINELKAAIDAGDTKRVEELKDQLTNAAHNPTDDAWDDFYDELGGFLNDEQMAKVDKVRSHTINPGARLDARSLLKLAHQIDELSGDQRKQLRDIERDARKEMRETRRDPKAAGEYDKKVEGQIREILTQEQTQEFDKLISKHGDSSSRRHEATQERASKRKQRQERRSGEGPTEQQPQDAGEEENP